MHTEDLLIDESTHRHDIEDIRKGLPQLNVVLAFALIKSIGTFVIKAVNAVNARTFVVASQHEEIFGIFDFVSEHETDGLYGLFSSINVVTQEKVVGISWESGVLE